MNIRTILDIQAGGPGSGCNPLVGKCGRFSKGEKKMLKEKGFMVSLKKKGEKFQGTPGQVLSKQKITQKVGKGKKAKYVTYNYTVLKGKDVSGTPKEFTSSPFKAEPPNTPHKMKGQFVEAMRLPVDAENRVSIVYDAGFNHEGEGSTVFVHKYRTSPTTGHAEVIEVERQGNDIIGTHHIGFGTGKHAKEFLKHRYGIDAKWSKK